MKTAFYHTKPYDRHYFHAAPNWVFHEERLTIDTVATAAGAGAVCVFVSDKLDAPCIQALADLGVQLIALRCAGFNNVDLDAAKAHGLTVVRVPAYSPHAVAEHSAALLLGLNRKLTHAYNRVREFNFSISGLEGFDLNGKTAGIIGTGKIGQLVAQILRGFGMRVLASDPKPSLEWAAYHGVTYVEQEVLLSESHVISLHAPLTSQTKYLLDNITLALTRPGVVIINTSRGKLVDTSALISALKSGHVAGAALDVYEEEEGLFFEDHSGRPMNDKQLAELISMPNVLVTSHQGFLTHEALKEIARVTHANLANFEARQPMEPGSLLVG